MQCFISFDKLALYCLCCLLFYTSKVIVRSRLCYIDMIVVLHCQDIDMIILFANNFRYKAISRVHNLASKTCFKTIKGYIASYCKKKKKNSNNGGAHHLSSFTDQHFFKQRRLWGWIQQKDITHIKHSNRRGKSRNRWIHTYHLLAISEHFYCSTFIFIFLLITGSCWEFRNMVVFIEIMFWIYN